MPRFSSPLKKRGTSSSKKDEAPASNPCSAWIQSRMKIGKATITKGSLKEGTDLNEVKAKLKSEEFLDWIWAVPSLVSITIFFPDATSIVSGVMYAEGADMDVVAEKFGKAMEMMKDYIVPETIDRQVVTARFLELSDFTMSELGWVNLTGTYTKIPMTTNITEIATKAMNEQPELFLSMGVELGMQGVLSAPEDDAMNIISQYRNVADAEAAGPKIADIFARMGIGKELFAGAPDRVIGDGIYFRLSRTSPKPAKGLPTIHMAISVPKEMEAEVDLVWKSHAEWMRKDHSWKQGYKGDDSEKSRLSEYWIAKGSELNNPLDESAGETGNLVYFMTESYAAQASIQKHLSLVDSNWSEGFSSLQKYLGEYSLFAALGSCKILTSMSDDLLEGDMVALGSPNIHIVLKVPKDMEEEMDAFWKGHETWMRQDHTLGPAGNDSEKSRLLQYWIAKGPLLNNPLDATSGETGELIYIMAEAYTSDESIAKHMELAKTNWEGMQKLTEEYVPTYGVVKCAPGGLKVLTNFEEPIADPKDKKSPKIKSKRVSKKDKKEVAESQITSAAAGGGEKKAEEPPAEEPKVGETAAPAEETAAPTEDTPAEEPKVE